MGSRGGATGGGVAGAAVEGVAQGQQTVEMTDDLVFDPDSVTIAPGTTVVWRNTGSIGHSVTAYEDEIPGGEAEYFVGGGGGALPAVPNSAKTLGVATVSALLSVLALAYFFLKYGGNYGLD